MRVLMICPELPRADRPGSMAPTARQIESLRQLGVDIDVVDMRGIPKLKYLLAMPKIRGLAKRADIVHAHFGFCGWLGYLSTRLLWRHPLMMLSFMGDDLLGTVYDTSGRTTRFSRIMVSANRWLAKKMDHVIVKSNEMASVIQPLACDVISNGIDADRFAPRDRNECRRQLKLSDDAALVLFPGDPDNPNKGYALAKASVDAVRETVDRRLELIPLWGIEPADVAVYMNACDVMLMTSWTEGSPNVVKEAMACNLPVVGVPVGDVPEMLSNLSGYACCSRDPNEIGNCLIELLSATEVAGRRAILDRGLDLHSVARRVLAIYERLLAQTDTMTQRCAASET
ncbi:MAG: glycosyltransferase [Pirellulaceae bacterium]